LALRTDLLGHTVSITRGAFATREPSATRRDRRLRSPVRRAEPSRSRSPSRRASCSPCGRDRFRARRHPSIPAAAESNGTIGRSSGVSTSTRSCSEGSTSSRSASRPPGVSASRRPPSAANPRTQTVETRSPLPAGLCRLGPEVVLTDRERGEVLVPTECEALFVGHVDQAPTTVQHLGPMPGITQRDRDLGQRRVVG
jgi:hypothetical protein